MLITLLGLAVLLMALWFWVTQPLFVQPNVIARVSVDPAQLEAHVRMLAEQLSPRDEGHPENLESVASYLKQEFAAAKAVVSEQAFQVQGKTYRNVIARFGPDTGERIIVGAHYDTAGPFPGADDNASGVAGLIELARLLGQVSPAVQVELVAFTLEEPPYFRTRQMGSAIHAASLMRRGVRVRAMLALEMIGCFSDAPGSQRLPASFLAAFYPSRGNFIGVVGTFGEGLLVRRVKAAMREASVLPVYSISAPGFIPGVDFSDHLNYQQAGYAAVMITDTAFYRNPNYHAASDRPETLDYQRMALVVEGVYAAVLDLTR
ncbi:MAG: M28 family peptidase [Pyrinomonadaceae bacterium]